MIMVIGATGRIGRAVIDHLLRAGVSVRAMTRRPAAANLPAAVEVVPGDLTEPASLADCLHGVDVVFLLWTAPEATLPVVISHMDYGGPARAGPKRPLSSRGRCYRAAIQFSQRTGSISQSSVICAV